MSEGRHVGTHFGQNPKSHDFHDFRGSPARFKEDFSLSATVPRNVKNRRRGERLRFLTLLALQRKKGEESLLLICLYWSLSVFIRIVSARSFSVGRFVSSLTWLACLLVC